MLTIIKRSMYLYLSTFKVLFPLNFFLSFLYQFIFTHFIKLNLTHDLDTLEGTNNLTEYFFMIFFKVCLFFLGSFFNGFVIMVTSLKYFSPKLVLDSDFLFNHLYELLDKKFFSIILISSINLLLSIFFIIRFNIIGLWFSNIFVTLVLPIFLLEKNSITSTYIICLKVMRNNVLRLIHMGSLVNTLIFCKQYFLYLCGSLYFINTNSLIFASMKVLAIFLDSSLSLFITTLSIIPIIEKSFYKR